VNPEHEHFDVIIDIANEFGDPGPNGRLDPGDIIGVWTSNGRGHEYEAEVHLVKDPGSETRYSSSSYVDFSGGYFDTTNGNRSLFSRIEGRIQFPDNGGQWTHTTPSIRGVRNRTPNGTVTDVQFNPATAVNEAWVAVYDGAKWHLYTSAFSQTPMNNMEERYQGESNVAQMVQVDGQQRRRWQLTSSNGRINFTITEGSEEFQSGDEVSFSVHRPVLQDGGRLPLVVIAHGAHPEAFVSQPKHVTYLNNTFRPDPGIGGEKDQWMTIIGDSQTNERYDLFIQWVGGENRWKVFLESVPIMLKNLLSVMTFESKALTV
jgi:hypothetical protein